VRIRCVKNAICPAGTAYCTLAHWEENPNLSINNHFHPGILFANICKTFSGREGGDSMKKYAENVLQSKLLTMYPDIRKKGISLNLNYDNAKKSYIVNLATDSKKETILLPEADAETCMTGMICQPFKAELDNVMNRFAGK
jgi:hypothetical protein